MFLSLSIICIVAATILAFVNVKTSDIILESKKQKLEKAIEEVVPPFDNSPVDEAYKAAIVIGDSVTIYPARNNGELVGVAIESNTMKGFSGEIKIIVGLKPDGEVIDFAVLEHAETPGLGDKIDPWFKTDKNNQNIIGRKLSAGALMLTKDGGDIDAITAATISSRAFLDAVNRAYSAFSGEKNDSWPEPPVSSSENTDSNTGATY